MSSKNYNITFQRIKEKPLPVTIVTGSNKKKERKLPVTKILRNNYLTFTESI